MSLTYLKTKHTSAAVVAVVIALSSGCGGGGGSSSVSATPSPVPSPVAPPSPGPNACSSAPLAQLRFASAIQTAQLGEPLAFAADAVPNPGCSLPGAYTLSGALPAGLSFNAQTAGISGTPTSNGAFQITVRVSGTDTPVASTSIQVQPLSGPVTQALSVALVTSTLPALEGPQLAPLGSGAAPVLVLMGKNPSLNRMEYWRSDNSGQSWVQISAPDSPQARSARVIANQFRITKANAGVFVLDAGGSSFAGDFSAISGTDLTGFYDVPARLYRYDGTAWSVVNSALPPVWAGNGFFSDVDIVHIAFERPQQRSLEISDDGGAGFSTYSTLDADPRTTLKAYANSCFAAAAGYYWYQPAQPNTTISSLQVRPLVNPGTPTSWANAGMAFALQDFVTTTTSCTAWNNKFWLASSPPGQTYLTLLSADDPAAVAYPQRYRTTPPFANLAPAGDRLIGVSVNASGLADKLWSIR